MKENFNYTIPTIYRVLNRDYRHSIVQNGEVFSISDNSTQIENGSLFVPHRATRDGHEFIPEALEKGAALFLCEKNHPILEKLTEAQKSKCLLVDDTLLALSKLAKFHRSRFNPTTIGITGSSGKTTTKELIGMLFKHLSPEEIVITEKNYNGKYGTPFTLFRITPKTKVLICEMGMSYKGELSHLSDMVQPDISIVTNVGSAHIENLGSIKEIAKAKSEIIDGMNKEGNLFIPHDISYRNIFVKKCKKKDVKLKIYELEKHPQLKIIKEDKNGFWIEVFGKQIFWEIPAIKVLQNLSGVVSIAQHLKLDTNQTIDNLISFKGAEKRLHQISSHYQLLDDCYNANPESMKSSLLALKQISEGKNFYAILGDMKELGNHSKNMHKDVGNFCYELGLTGLITYGQDSIYIAREYSRHKNAEIHHFSSTDIDKLVEYTKNSIPSGSHILIKGSRSMKMEVIVEKLA